MISRLLGARSKAEMTGLVLDEPAWEIDGVSDPAAPYVSIAIIQPTVDRLVELAAGLPPSEVCWHMHVFVEGQVLLSGHDAFDIPFLVSAAVPEGRVQQFSRAAGGTASRFGGPSKRDDR